MEISELIDAAKRKQGSIAAVAEQLGTWPGRLAEWRAGRRKPDAADIMLMAEMAELPPLATLLEVESRIDTERSSVWQRALTSLRSASVTGVLALFVWTGLGTAPNHAYAADQGDTAFTRQGSLVRSQYRPPRIHRCVKPER
jgi:transcriptional regulator with XRE-family HTH domain